MYLPEAFAERDPVLLAQFIDAFPLGLLITNELITNELITSDSEHDTQRIVANLLPFELSAGAAHAGVLRAHIARANPLAQTLAAAAVSAEVLAVFQGPQSYVSPGWYPGKRVHGKVVPTWNYTMVQARGRMRTIDDAGWLEALITRLTARHESAFASPWAPGDAPPDFLESMLKAIIGIEIDVHALVGKWKLSQNRDVADRAGVVAGLAQHTRTAGNDLASWMAACETATRNST